MPDDPYIEPASTYEDLFEWADRLEGLAKVQGGYHRALQDEGFDAENAFRLVYLWTDRVAGWAAQPALRPAVDPTSARPDEDYLLDDADAEDADADADAA